MKFSKLKPCSYFVVINLDKKMPILVRDTVGRIRRFPDYSIIKDHGIYPEDEVQLVSVSSREF